MKKIITFLLGLTALVALAACGGNGDNGDYIVFTIGASSVPHAQILAQAAPLMLEEGFVLEIVEFDDFVLPNIALRDGAVDANFFQHRPFLANFNANHGTDLVPVFGVHFEPLRLYAGRLYSLDDITSGATIAIPDDPSNEARALQLLDDLELNRNDLNITPLAAELLPRILPDVDFAVINGNFALQGAVFYRNIYGAAEADESEAAENFTNFVVVRAGYEDNKALQALIRAISSDVVRQFIHDEYLGRIVPQF